MPHITILNFNESFNRKKIDLIKMAYIANIIPVTSQDNIINLSRYDISHEIINPLPAGIRNIYEERAPMKKFFGSSKANYTFCIIYDNKCAIREDINWLLDVIEDLEPFMAVNDSFAFINQQFITMNMFNFASGDFAKHQTNEMALGGWEQHFGAQDESVSFNKGFNEPLKIDSKSEKICMYLNISEMFYLETHDLEKISYYISKTANEVVIFNDDLTKGVIDPPLLEEFIAIDIQNVTGQIVEKTIKPGLLAMLNEVKNCNFNNALIHMKKDLADSRNDQENIIKYLKSHNIKVTIINESTEAI